MTLCWNTTFALIRSCCKEVYKVEKSKEDTWEPWKLRSRNFSMTWAAFFCGPKIKTCYDKAGNLPNKGRNFNTQTWWKIVYFLFVWLVGIGFRQNFFRVLPNFGDFGAKKSFFHYIINQNRNNFIKHCSPPCTKKPLISEMCTCIYRKKFVVQVGCWYKGGGGGTMFYRQKTKGVSA